MRLSLLPAPLQRGPRPPSIKNHSELLRRIVTVHSFESLHMMIRPSKKHALSSFSNILQFFKTKSESGLLRRELRGLRLPEQVQPATPVCLRHTTLPIHSLCLLSSYYVTGTKFYLCKANTPYFILQNLSASTPKQFIHLQ